MKCEISTQDLPQKLDQTIIRYDDVPYYLRIEGGEQVRLYELTRGLDKVFGSVSVRDDKIDISSVPLGYVNYIPWKAVFYLTRQPTRKVKQGLTIQNVKSSYFPGVQFITDNHFYPKAQEILFHKSFKESVMGQFPGLQNALKGLRGIHKSENRGHYSAAISQDIALLIDEQGIIKVYYKNDYVGWIPPNEFTVLVNEKNGLGWVVSRYLSHELGWTIE